jgi:hypothetical protein
MKQGWRATKRSGTCHRKPRSAKPFLCPRTQESLPTRTLAAEIFAPLQAGSRGAHSQNREDVRSEHDEWLAGDSKDRRHRVDGEYYVVNFDETRATSNGVACNLPPILWQNLWPSTIGITGRTFRSRRITKFASGTVRKTTVAVMISNVAVPPFPGPLQNQAMNAPL